ncbi:MAG: hypothetical protein AAFP84_05850 [Actinomycetota bacterium]
MTDALDRPVAKRPDGLRSPGPWSRLRELRLGIDLPRYAWHTREVLGAPSGDGRTVMLVPGFKTTDRSLVPLRTFLGSRGHHARDWGFGVNNGDVDGLLERTKERVVELAERSGRPINLVGWSLGGVYARESARDHPEHVHRVATMGTPLFGPRHTIGHSFYSEDELTRIDGQIDERSAEPIRRPVLAIYSRNDGIVDWRACPDTETPDARNVEVASGHVGMGLDPTVWRRIADFFAAD